VTMLESVLSHRYLTLVYYVIIYPLSESHLVALAVTNLINYTATGTGVDANFIIRPPTVSAVFYNPPWFTESIFVGLAQEE
jgi:hypothetical protein